MEWITKRGVFSTPLVIKMLPVRDMSLPPAGEGYSDFDELVYNVKTNLTKNAKVKGISIKGRKTIDGFVDNIKIDYDKQRIRIFVRKDDANEVAEVYPESVYRDVSVRECKSYVLDLSAFIAETDGK